MILDRIQLSGPDAYFQDPNNPGKTNLAAHVTSRTAPLGKGMQKEISGIELSLEAAKDVDLLDLFQRQDTPLFSVSVMKEMSPTLFADPFEHRVHNISGFDDFKRGTFKNGKPMDVDGIPTIVSIGSERCTWTSALYPMPEPVKIRYASWELAPSRKTEPDYFKYSIKLRGFDASRNPIQEFVMANGLDPTKARNAKNPDERDLAFYQLEFGCDVTKDVALYEKHTTLVGESIGTPLLRAINLLEPVESIYDIYSLQELLSRSSEYHLFEFEGRPLTKMTATFALSATLVNSEYQTIVLADPNDPNSADPNDPNSFFEFVEIAVKSDNFSLVEARLVGEEIVRSITEQT